MCECARSRESANPKPDQRVGGGSIAESVSKLYAGKQGDDKMGGSLRKLFDKVFGNQDMRVRDTHTHEKKEKIGRGSQGL